MAVTAMPAAVAKVSSARLMLEKARAASVALSSTASSLFTANTMRGHAQQLAPAANGGGFVAAAPARGLPFELGGVDQHHGSVGAAAAVTMLRVYCSWPGASPMMNLRSSVLK
jgi:hypothetical protein